MQNVRVNRQVTPSVTEICDGNTGKQVNEKVWMKVLGPEKSFTS